jgi:hypothetical protein
MKPMAPTGDRARGWYPLSTRMIAERVGVFLLERRAHERVVASAPFRASARARGPRRPP